MANEENKSSADDPFAGWAEALEEQKKVDDKDTEQGGPLSGEAVRPFAAAGDPPINDINMVLVNGYLIAQGEVVVVNDKFGIRLTDVVTPSERLRRVSRG